MATILVVEDSAVDRRVVGELLKKDGRWKIDFAGNGSEAMARMKETLPDVIVTDLQMPDMDGLELVAAARVHYPDVPVILITAHGSELLAVEALERGAAHYVPKSQMVGKLRSTVEEVLAVARADRSYGQLIDCMARTEFTFFLHNNPALIEALVDLVQKMVVGVRFCDFAGRLQIGMALKQALTNALYHGNLELSMEQMEQAQDKEGQGVECSLVEHRRSEAPYKDRKISVDVKLTEDEVRLAVGDEGPGFNAAALAEAGDAAAPENEGGRGLVLLRAFMDEVAFNPAGNQVTMVKRRTSTGSGLAASDTRAMAQGDTPCK